MAKQLKLRRGTTSQHSSFTGAEGEVTVDTDKETLVVHDGSTAGGHPVAAEDMANVSSASIAGRLANDSIATSKIAAGALPSDVTVASANIVDGTIVNADVNASAAIAGSKISPNFGAQNIQTTGQLQLAGSAPTILLNDENNENDFEVSNTNGTFKVRDIDAGVDRLTINSSGTAGFSGNLDVGAGLDVTGTINATSNIATSGNITANNGTITVSGTSPKITFTETNDNPDYKLEANGGSIAIVDTTASATRFAIGSATTNVYNNLDVSSGVDVTGNITVTGTVDGVDVAALNTTVGNLSLSGSTLSNGTTATTQSQGDNSTKVATTAYTDTAVANLVDSSPGALNTLNELAAAINDDANFSTTVNNNIATKLPLAGGTVTGTLNLSSTSQDCLNFNGAASSDRRGVAFNGRIALSSDQSDGYLRLNDASEFGNGVYTPGVMRADGGYQVSSNTVINSSGQLLASRLTGALPALDGSALTGIVSFVSGMIILWSGSTSNIPSGWVLCNGSNSTPDLRDRFVIGAGNSYSVGATGGSTTDSVNVTVSGTTGNNSGSNIRVAFGNQNWHPYAAPQNHNHSFSGSGSDTVSTMSPYYALCYIMKT